MRYIIIPLFVLIFIAWSYYSIKEIILNKKNNPSFHNVSFLTYLYATVFSNTTTINYTNIWVSLVILLFIIGIMFISIAYW